MIANVARNGARQASAAASSSRRAATATATSTAILGARNYASPTSPNSMATPVDVGQSSVKAGIGSAQGSGKSEYRVDELILSCIEFS